MSKFETKRSLSFEILHIMVTEVEHQDGEVWKEVIRGRLERTTVFAYSK